MRKSLVSLCATALALLLASGGARADTVPWGYSAADTTIFNSNNPLQTSSIQFKGSNGVANGDSGIIIYNLTTTSAPVTGTIDNFSNVPFDLNVTLTDVTSTGSTAANAKSSDSVDFKGTFSATNVTTKSLLPAGNNWTTPTSGTVVLGSADTGWRKYQVDIASFTPPGQPGGAPGSIQAIVHITDTTAPTGTGGTGDGTGTPPDDGTGSSGPPSPTPEPTSLLLASLGVPVFLARRRKARLAAAA